MGGLSSDFIDGEGDKKRGAPFRYTKTGLEKEKGEVDIDILVWLGRVLFQAHLDPGPEDALNEKAEG